MKEIIFSTKLDGLIGVTSSLHENNQLLKDTSLYKIIWITEGEVTIEIDHVITILHKDEIVTLTPLHQIKFISINGEYTTLLFNSNFYCIYGHDNEVSCNGFLFHGSSNVAMLQLSDADTITLNSIIHQFCDESSRNDDFQEEMLRMLLKHFIIACTRMARQHYKISNDNISRFDIIRQFYILVDTHYKEKKQVQDYASMLYKSPKTLTNIFSEYKLTSPLRVIHERIYSEACRLLLNTEKSAKEISDILGFEDIATFSRFFKKMSGDSISDYRKRVKTEH